MNSIEGVAITGTIGVGKTVVAEALSELVHHQGKRHALIDVDWLAQLYPPPQHDDPCGHTPRGIHGRQRRQGRWSSG